MIACPRCGFSQPKDKYCAQCGVDMEAFRPKPAPLSKRILTNPLFFMAFIFAIVFTSILAIRKQTPRGVATNTGAAPTLFAHKETSRVAASTETPDVAPIVRPTTLNMEGTTREEAPPKVANVKVIVNYVEINKGLFDRLKVESQNAGLYGDFGDLRAGILPEMAKKMADRERIRILSTVEKTFNPQNLTQQWFVGRSGPNGEPELGFELAMAIESLDGPTLRGDIELIRIGRDFPGAPPTRHPYPLTSFEVAPSFGWILNVSLPALHPQELEADLPAALQIYKSPRFTKATDFALMIQFQRGTEESLTR